MTYHFNFKRSVKKVEEIILTDELFVIKFFNTESEWRYKLDPHIKYSVGKRDDYVEIDRKMFLKYCLK